MFAGPSRRLVVAVMLIAGLILGCTTPAPTPPASKDGASAKPGASPSPLAQASPIVASPRPIVGGGAAQPAARATQGSIGGSAIIVVPTPNFASNPTPAPAPLAPVVSLSTPQAANLPQVTGTLSRIPTAIPSGGGGGGGAGGGGGGAPGGGGGGGAAAAPASTGGGGGGGGGIQTIPAVLTATPPVRIAPQPQPAIVFPGGGGGGGGGGR